MINQAEKLVKEDFELKGYKTLRKGHPDFVFYKETKNDFYDIDLIFVEVKGRDNRLSKEQKIYKQILERRGLKVLIIHPQKPEYLSRKERRLKQKERIQSILLNYKRVSTSRFVGLLGIDYDSVKKLLEELESENQIIKEEETNATYWMLKNGN